MNKEVKNLIFAILMLSALTAWFSFRGEIVPLERTQKEGWAFFGGTSGEPTPGDGENGEVDVFSINSPQETTQTQQKSPISVTVVEQTEEKEQTQGMFFIGAMVGSLATQIGIICVFAILYLIDKYKRRDFYEKCKNRP